MKMIKVYTTPDCQQCEQTKKFFNARNVPFETIDLSKDDEAMTMVKALGYSSAPVVIAGEKHWSGYRHDKLLDAAHLAKGA